MCKLAIRKVATEFIYLSVQLACCASKTGRTWADPECQDGVVFGVGKMHSIFFVDKDCLVDYTGFAFRDKPAGKKTGQASGLLLIKFSL